MTYDSDDFALFAPDETTETDILDELDSLKGLLADRDEPLTVAPPRPATAEPLDIPVLSEVVAHPDDDTADARGLRTAMEAHDTDTAAPNAAEIEAIVEVLLERQLPQIRERLKNELLAELQQRGLLR